MNLITIEVICPAVSGSFDFRFPVKMKFSDIKTKLIEDIRIFEDQQELFEQVSIFTENGCVTGEMTLADAGVKNGDRIIIV